MNTLRIEHDTDNICDFALLQGQRLTYILYVYETFTSA